MASDCAVEVGKHGVCVVSLWPGAVRTENIAELFALPTDTDALSDTDASTDPASLPNSAAESEEKNKKIDSTNEVVAVQKDNLVSSLR